MRLTVKQRHVLERLLRGDVLTTRTDGGRGFIRRRGGRVSDAEVESVTYRTIESLERRKFIEIVDDRRMDTYTIHWHGLTPAGREEARR